MTRSARLCGVALVLVSALAPRSTLANGAFPAVSQLVADPADARHLVLRSNFGLITTHDAGKSWSWACESALGYANVEPPIAVLSNGATLLGLPDGIRVVEPAGCDVTSAVGIRGNVVDLSREPAVDHAALAVTVDFGVTSSQVWESTDAGQHWSPLGKPLTQFTALTIDAAKTDPQRIYVTGMDWTGNLSGVLLSSDDHGTSWLSHPVPNTDAGKQPYIAALAPDRVDTVYVRLTGLPGRLEVTHTSGAEFTTAFSMASPIEGFAVSPDGQTLLASSVNDGIFRASAATLAFERLSCQGLSCLSWSEAGLIGCGTQAGNGFGLGRSTDQGGSFDVFLDLLCLNGSSACDAGTDTGKACPSLWPAVAEALGQMPGSCDPQASSTPLDTSCLPPDGAAGAPPTSGGEATIAASAGAPSGGGAPSQEPETDSAGEAPRAEARPARAEGGCSCRLGARTDLKSGPTLGLLLLGGWYLRIRRRNRA